MIQPMRNNNNSDIDHFWLYNLGLPTPFFCCAWWLISVKVNGKQVSSYWDASIFVFSRSGRSLKFGKFPQRKLAKTAYNFNSKWVKNWGVHKVCFVVPKYTFLSSTPHEFLAICCIHAKYSALGVDLHSKILHWH